MELGSSQHLAILGGNTVVVGQVQFTGQEQVQQASGRAKGREYSGDEDVGVKDNRRRP
jgi:hypothetical protein